MDMQPFKNKMHSFRNTHMQLGREMLFSTKSMAEKDTFTDGNTQINIFHISANDP